MIRVLVIAGVRVYREALGRALEQHAAIAVVGELEAWRDALPRVAAHATDIVVLGVKDPVALRRLRAADPAVRVIALEGDHSLAQLVATITRGASFDFRVLGPLEVSAAGRPLKLEKGRQRALLGLLLLHPNEVVARDRLLEALWGASPPPTALTALHGHVSRLRRLLGPGRVQTRVPGYLLRVAPGELDADRFRALLGARRHAEALALWRGAPLADFARPPFAQAEIACLLKLRCVALEGWCERELAAGRHGTLVAELEAAVRQFPLHERLSAQLMLALYRSGRRAEALGVCRATRARLVDELGLEPGDELRELEHQILFHDRALGVAA